MSHPTRPPCGRLPVVALSARAHRNLIRVVPPDSSSHSTVSAHRSTALWRAASATLVSRPTRSFACPSSGRITRHAADPCCGQLGCSHFLFVPFSPTNPPLYISFVVGESGRSADPSRPARYPISYEASRRFVEGRPADPRVGMRGARPTPELVVRGARPTPVSLMCALRPPPNARRSCRSKHSNRLPLVCGRDARCGRARRRGARP